MLFPKVFLNLQTKLFYFQGFQFIKEHLINIPNSNVCEETISNVLLLLEELFEEIEIPEYYFAFIQVLCKTIC
jgi:hypothetical protein